MDAIHGPKGTLVRWFGTLLMVAGVVSIAHAAGITPEGHKFTVGLAMVGAGLLLRIEAAITTGLSDRAAAAPPHRALPYGDAED